MTLRNPQMQTFTVIVTRDVTASFSVEVEAIDSESAENFITDGTLEEVEELAEQNGGWKLDDGNPLRWDDLQVNADE